MEDFKMLELTHKNLLKKDSEQEKSQMYNTHLFPSFLGYCIIYKDPSKKSTLQPALYAYLMKTKCVLHSFMHHVNVIYNINIFPLSKTHHISQNMWTLWQGATVNAS